jgi:hypothetical protein
MLDEKEKKEYSAPELTVVELADQLQPLCSSFEGDGAEFGLAPTPNDHLA